MKLGTNKGVHMNLERSSLIARMKQLNDSIVDQLSYKQYTKLKIIGQYIWGCNDETLYKTTKSIKIIEAMMLGRKLQDEFKTKYSQTRGL